MSDKTDDIPKVEQVDINYIATTPRLNTDKPSSFVMLQTNSTFEKLLSKDIQEKPTFEEVIVILNKKSDHRNREDIKKLIYFFQGLSFFESLKKESEVDEDIIYQCCRELKYRRYTQNQKIITYGEEGNEFYIIIKGEVDILTPKTVEVKLNQTELHEYIEQNQEFIIWDRHNRHLLEHFNEATRVQNSSNHMLRTQMSTVGGGMRSQMRKSIQTMALSLDREISMAFEFQFLTTSLTLVSGLGFGELALMGTNNKKPEKRAATVIAKTDSILAVLDKDDFTKVFLYSMQKKLDAKVEFFKNFRISEGISRTNLNKLSYYLKEKYFRRRDIVFKEGDVADHVYFIKEGEFEITKNVKTKLDKVTVQKGQTTLLKNIEVKVSIIGPNQIIGLDEQNKEKTTLRQHTVQCITEKAVVYQLTREEYFTRFFKQIQKHVVNESQRLKEPFFSQRLSTLQTQANRENMKWLQQKERYLSRETLSQETLKECKSVVDSVQNEELCNLLLKHKLLKRPQIKIERVTSAQDLEEEEEILNDYDPNRFSNKDYFLKMSKLYNQFVFNTNQFPQTQRQKSQQRDQSPSPTNKLSQIDQDEYGLKHAQSTVNFDNQKINAQISPKNLKNSTSQKSGVILYNQSTTFNSIKENQLRMTQNLANQLSKNPSLKSLNSPQALHFNKFQSEFDKQGADDRRSPEFKISLKKNQSNINLHNPITESTLANGEQQQKPQQSTHRTNNNKIMGNIIIEESLMNIGQQTNHQPQQLPLSNSQIASPQTINNMAKSRTRKQNVLKQIVTDSTNQNNANGNYTISMNQSQNDQYNNDNQSINLNDTQQKQLKTQDLQQKIGRITSGEKNLLLVHNSSSPQFNINKVNQIRDDQGLISSDSKRLNRRQKSQTQFRQVKGNMKGKKTSLTIEDIQAHLQQSQNSLLKLLEKRLKEKHDKHAQENNLLHQQLHFMNSHGKLQELDNNNNNHHVISNNKQSFSNTRHKVLSSQYMYSNTLGGGQPTQPFSPHSKSQLTQDLNNSKKSNIYFNMYITRKRL